MSTPLATVGSIKVKLGPDLIRTVHGVGYAFEPADGAPAS